MLDVESINLLKNYSENKKISSSAVLRTLITKYCKTGEIF